MIITSKRCIFSTVLLTVILLFCIQPVTSAAFEITIPDSMPIISDQASTPAPGIFFHEIVSYSGDGQRVEMYVLEADLSEGLIQFYGSYRDDQQEVWGMQKLTEQAAIFEQKHPGTQVVAAINGSYYNMSSGAPNGAFVMEGVAGNSNPDAPPMTRPFFAILNDGTAMIGAAGEYDTYKDQIREAIGGEIHLIDNGRIVSDFGSDWKYPRQTIGVTADGRVFIMTADGYRKPFSDGVSLQEQAEIMLSLGCVEAIHLDGGGSATTCVKPEGENELKIVNTPADGFERPVSSALLLVYSGAISSEFDHAVLHADRNRITSGSSTRIAIAGVSATGHQASVPEGAVLRVAESAMGTIADGQYTADPVFTGDAVLQLVYGEAVLAELSVRVVDYTQLSVSCIDGIYYEIDENGQIIEKYTGLFLDSTDGKYSYALDGVLRTGWVLIEEDWYYFNSAGDAVTGKVALTDHVEFEFEENGKLVDGVWVKNDTGTRYYYGPGYYRATGANSYSKWAFFTIHGNPYCFDTNGNRLEGIQWITASSDRDHYWYDFGTDGIARKFDYTGPYMHNGELTFIDDGVTAYNRGLFIHEGNYYYLNSSYRLAISLYNVLYPNGLLSKGKYDFNPDGTMITNGVTYWASILCYVEDGVPTDAGVVYDKADDCFYYARSGGKITFGEFAVPADRTNGLIPAGTYDFGEDGKLHNNCDTLGHNWVDATCTSAKTCSRCSTVEGDALGHSWTDATCTAPRTCSVCSSTEGEALDHNWIDATCAAPKTCSVCSVTEGETLDHNWIDATCTAAKICANCSVVDGDALGHDMGEWVTTKEPAPGAEGENSRFCQREGCAYKETESIPAVQLKNGWIKESGKWYYYKADEPLTSQWLKDNSKWYYLSDNGVMATGWVKVDGKWYLMNSSGAMLTGWQMVSGKWYYMKNEMKTGWVLVGSKWYYMDANGAMQTGWEKVDSKWYYLNSEMKTGWQKIDGKWYYLKSEMKTGWQKISNKWYYLGTNGAMQTGWVKLSGKWYYLNDSGAMVTGAQTIDGKTYKFNSSGVWIG